MLDRTLQAACAAALFAAAAGPVLAQESIGSVRDFASAAPGDSPLSAPSGVEITASEGDSKATIAFAYSESETDDGVGVFSVTGLKFSTPTNPDGGGSTFISRKGIPGGTTASFSFTRTRSEGVDSPAAWGRAGELCREALTTAAFASRLQAARQERARAAGKPVPPAAPVPEALQGAEVGERKDCATIVGQYNPGDLAEFKARSWEPTGLVTIWSVGAEVGYKDFDYIDGTTLAALSERQTVWSARGSISWHEAKSNWFFTLGAEHQDDYAAGDKQTLCANTGAPILTCVTGPVGAPRPLQRDLVSMEYRRKFKRVAVSLSVTQDLNNDVTAIDVPVYLIRDKDDGLTGGVRLGWSGDQDEIGASVFVSKAFSLFGN